MPQANQRPELPLISSATCNRSSSSEMVAGNQVVPSAKPAAGQMIGTDVGRQRVELTSERITTEHSSGHSRRDPAVGIDAETNVGRGGRINVIEHVARVWPSSVPRLMSPVRGLYVEERRVLTTPASQNAGSGSISL